MRPPSPFTGWERIALLFGHGVIADALRRILAQRLGVEYMNITVTVNGKRYERDVEPRMLLVHFLREELGLTGTNIGCDTSQCGACTVHLDGRSIKSCACFAVQADGREVTTIEGMAQGDALHPMQTAFWEKHGLQCGFCTPGMIMASTAFLKSNPHPTEEEIRHGIEGNMCRCTGYQNIVAAIKSASEHM